MRISDWSSDVCSSDLGTCSFASVRHRNQWNLLQASEARKLCSLGRSRAARVCFHNQGHPLLHKPQDTGRCGRIHSTLPGTKTDRTLREAWDHFVAVDRNSTRLNPTH